ncbi:MAG: class I SAM-dependent methyltransferase [Halieaceae bacterium]
MTLKVYTGLPGSGKTSALITEMASYKDAGHSVTLLLSSEHDALTRRPNVKPGGLMGCRDRNKSFPINAVIDSAEAGVVLASSKRGEMIVFDEAQYFQPSLANNWLSAAKEGVEVRVGTPSKAQLALLSGEPHEHVHLSVQCSRCDSDATKVIYQNNLTFPDYYCSDCYEEGKEMSVEALMEKVRAANPFPGDLHTYQPFFGVEMDDWELVRKDCYSRLNIVLDAVSRCESIGDKLANSTQPPSFVDLGCCSGFFSVALANSGFRSHGVDVSKDFIDWASQLAAIKAQDISYTQEDLLEHLLSNERHYDVVSSFATVQWVMAQKGYEAGLQCFAKIFEKTDSVCVIEMGYTTEPIYQDKIQDRPAEIDRSWVMKLMEESGQFKTIELHPAGEHGIWRDIFVGFKNVPTAPRTFDSFPVTGATQISNAEEFWDDGWAGKTVRVSFQSERGLSGAEFRGWCPKECAGANLTIRVADEIVTTAEVHPGKFKLKFPVAMEKDAKFDVRISADRTFQATGDDRRLAFIIQSLAFK